MEETKDSGQFPKIKIGSQTYSVTSSDPAELGQDDLTRGHVLYRNNKIWVADNLCPERFRLWLLHEITHAVMEEIACEPDEQLVERLSRLLLEVMRDNPKYFGTGGILQFQRDAGPDGSLA